MNPLRSIALAALAGTAALLAACKEESLETNPRAASASVDEWVYEVMCDNYLWNEEVRNLEPNYGLGYKEFLLDLLKGVARQGEANRDDGRWDGGVRSYFYSYIEKADEESRAAGDAVISTGITPRRARLGDDPAASGFLIWLVTPGSPADRAGLRRGMFITAVDGEPCGAQSAQQDIERMYGRIVSGPAVRLDVSDVEVADGAFIPVRKREYSLTAERYTEPALYAAECLIEGESRIAYLLYMGFDRNADEELIAAFRKFKAFSPTDLILDLRYNGGGHVVSSAVLGTLVAGSARAGELFARLTYNADRTLRGEQGIYRIGRKECADGSYAPIEEALADDAALGLRRVYVLTSVRTASASEMLINGLRGLGIDVRLIGTATNGKNVGMEGYAGHSTRDGRFDFFPVTFYAENACGSRDYSDGFAPNVEADPDAYFPGAFGTKEDILCNLAFEWILTARQPSPASAPRMRVPAASREAHDPLERVLARHPKGAVVLREAR